MAKPCVQPTELPMHAFFSLEKGQRWLNSQTAAFESQRCVSKAMHFWLLGTSLLDVASGLRILMALEWQIRMLLALHLRHSHWVYFLV